MVTIIDPSGRGPSRATLVRRGLVALLVIAGIITALFLQSRGAFRSSVAATVRLDNIGDGIEPGADVKLRGLLVGTVTTVRVHPTGDDPGQRPAHELELALRPELAASIPAGVTARLVPTNVFGAPSVELLDPPTPTTRALAPGAVIPGDTSAQTIQLQTVIDRLDKVLTAIHPAELNVALTNIAQALHGRGHRIGATIPRLDAYLTTLNDHRDTFTTDLRLLAADLHTLADTAPELLDTVDNAVTTAQTVTAKRTQLAATLLGTTTTSRTTNTYLADNTDHIRQVTQNLAGILAALAPQRDLIPRSLTELSGLATSLGPALNPHTSDGIRVTLNPTPYQPYTATGCPRYPGINGPNCPTRTAK